MGVYEEQRRRVERNMLALSSLNLATSSFAGGEIQKMLAQTLDRVLNVARIPAGALCLHYGDPEGPASVVTTGLGEHLQRRHAKRAPRRLRSKMVARLGGLMVLAELDRDSNWEALEREPAFKEIRKQLLSPRPAHRSRHQPASQRTSLRRPATRHSRQPQIHHRRTAPSSSARPSNRPGSRK